MHSISYERGLRLQAAMESRQSVVIRKLGRHYREERGYGRFLHNPRISVADIAAAYLPAVPSDIGSRSILLVGDSTEANFGLGGKKTGLSALQNEQKGMNLHPVIAIDAENGGCYGVASACVWERGYYVPDAAATSALAAAADAGGEIARKKKLHTLKKQHNAKQPYADKEDYRWLSSAYAAQQRYAEAAQLTVVSDSETDAYEIFAGLQAKGLGFVIRAFHDRRLVAGEGGKLSEQMARWTTDYTYEVDLPATDRRSRHRATLGVSWGTVDIPKPQLLRKHHLHNGSDALPNHLPLTVVRVKEQPISVVGHEQPIEWILFTTHAVHSAEDALKIVQIYRWRWVIEQLFRSLKSEGLDIEKSEVRSYHALTKLAILGLIACGNIMALVQARNGTTTQEATQVFDKHEITVLESLRKSLEGKTDKQKNPHPAGSLAYAAWVIARLGGWKGLPSQRPPGPITFKNGLIEFYHICNGFFLANLRNTDP